MRTLVLSLCLACTFANAAMAQTEAIFDAPTEGYTFYNRPGATLQDHREDIESCFDPVMAMGAVSGRRLHDPGVAVYGVAGALAGSLFVATMQAQIDRNARVRAVTGHYENCMIARGWRLVRVAPNVGRRLALLNQDRLLAELEPMIAAEAPAGEVVRRFSNELAQPLTQPLGEERGRAVSLSLRAMPRETIVTERARSQSRGAGDSVQSGQENSSVPGLVTIEPVEDLSAFSSDAALVIVTVDDPTRALTFVREGSADAEGAIFFAPFFGEKRDADSAPLSLEEAASAMARTYVFAVSPGQWRISQISVHGGTVSLCLGAPAFDVGRNEVVFAGAFGRDFIPDLALASAQSVLASRPDIAARLRPAVYVNGNASECGDAALFYAYEIPNAPFVEGYRGGSRALAHQTASTSDQ